MRGYWAVPVLFIIALTFVAIPSAYATLPSFDITVLNEQSYPTLGSTWTVQFTSTGTGDLSITSVDGTSFGNTLPDDLKFLELNNGYQTLNPVVENNSITYHNYSSGEIGFVTVQVLTPGKHHLEFRFENIESNDSVIKYAHNIIVIKPSDEIKRTASDAAAGDFFGNSVAISGDTVLVGAVRDDSFTGSAYIFERNQGSIDNWGEVKKITASDGVPGDNFGFSVAIFGDTVVVGAPDDNSSTGAAYIFSRNQDGIDNWGEVKMITASVGVPGDLFGFSVAIFGDTVVVGAFGVDSSTGTAYIFSRNQDGIDNWGQVRSIIADDDAFNDFFGFAVDLFNDVIIVSSPGNDDNGGGSGSAYLFERNQGGIDNWGQVQKITASDGAPSDQFGISVAISDDTVVVGANCDDSCTGSAYIFERNKNGADLWGEVQKITASDGAASDQFGFSVAISGATVLVAAPVDDSGTGSSYIFERNQGGEDNWGEVRKITASDGATDDFFGASVGISGDTVVVGAKFDDSFTGAAYIYPESQVAASSSWAEIDKQLASDGAAGDQFGFSVAISGDTVVVGADRDNSLTGSTYIFSRNQGGIADNWGEVRKITALDAANNDFFGFSVAISGDTVVVGASGDDSGTGSAYVFERNKNGADLWGEVQKITASDAAASDQFGNSVAIFGDTVVVGASRDDSFTGAAYIFERNQGGIADNWGEVQKLTASDGALEDNFGTSVAIFGDTVLVGAAGGDSFTGSAYIFSRNQGGIADNWGEVKKITASDGVSGDFFGFSVAISGDTVVVGAFGDDSFIGSSYIFSRNQGGIADNWGEVRMITASDAAASDQFGNSVSISGDTVLVGANGGDSFTGSAYIFERNQGGVVDNWGQVKKITASDAAASDQFGRSVAISGDTVVVGAIGDDDNGNNSGSSYIFYENSCVPPSSVDWTITSSCILANSATVSGNLIVQNNSVLIIPSGLSLDIDFANNFLSIQFGSGIRIQAGGTIT